MGRRATLRPAAKVNLHLSVLGRRFDGFHELETLFQSIDLRDELGAEATDEPVFELDVRPPGSAPAGDDNLVIAAARLVADVTGIRRGVRFRLAKRIPRQSGLGGGSADAAAALLLVDDLWGCGFTVTDLDDLAARLGSDVPFFLHGGLARGSGRGEVVVELEDLQPMSVVVTVPGVRLSTSKVFTMWDRRLTSHRPEGTLDALAAGPRGPTDWRRMTNELEGAVVDGWPVVGEALEKLRAARPIHAALSGSGAASFALFSQPEAACRAAAGLPSDWWVHVGTTLARSEARLGVRSSTDGGGR